MKCPKCGFDKTFEYKYLGIGVYQCEICGNAWSVEDENKDELRKEGYAWR